MDTIGQWTSSIPAKLVKSKIGVIKQNMSQNALECDLKQFRCINKECINASGYQYGIEDHKMN